MATLIFTGVHAADKIEWSKPLTLKDLQNIDALKKDAANGNVYAQAILGESYGRGELGVKENKKETFKFIESAAKKNHPIAFYQLGRIYESGL